MAINVVLESVRSRICNFCDYGVLWCLDKVSTNFHLAVKKTLHEEEMFLLDLELRVLDKHFPGNWTITSPPTGTEQHEAPEARRRRLKIFLEHHACTMAAIKPFYQPSVERWCDPKIAAAVLGTFLLRMEQRDLHCRDVLYSSHITRDRHIAFFEADFFDDLAASLASLLIKHVNHKFQLYI